MPFQLLWSDSSVTNLSKVHKEATTCEKGVGERTVFSFKHQSTHEECLLFLNLTCWLGNNLTLTPVNFNVPSQCSFRFIEYYLWQLQTYLEFTVFDANSSNKDSWDFRCHVIINCHLCGRVQLIKQWHWVFPTGQINEQIGCCHGRLCRSRRWRLLFHRCQTGHVSRKHGGTIYTTTTYSMMNNKPQTSQTRLHLHDVNKLWKIFSCHMVPVKFFLFFFFAITVLLWYSMPLLQAHGY